MKKRIAYGLWIKFAMKLDLYIDRSKRSMYVWAVTFVIRSNKINTSFQWRRRCKLPTAAGTHFFLSHLTHLHSQKEMFSNFMLNLHEYLIGIVLACIFVHGIIQGKKTSMDSSKIRFIYQNRESHRFFPPEYCIRIKSNGFINQSP